MFTSSLARAALISIFVLGGAGLSARGVFAADPDGQGLQNRLERIERDLRDLQRDYYRGGGGAMPAGSNSSQMGGGGGEASDLSVRMTALETSLRSVTGQIEQMNYRQSQIEGRLSAIEQASGIKPPTNQSGQGAPTVLGSATGNVPPPEMSSGPVGDAQAYGASDKAPPNGGVETLGSYSGSSVPPSPGAPAKTAMSSTSMGAVGKSVPAGDADAQYAAAFDVLMRGDNESGAVALKSFVSQNPTSPKAGEAYYWLGEAQLAQKAYREAAEAFLTTVQKYPKDPKAPQAFVKLGVTLVQGGQKTEGCKQLKTVKSQFPKASPSVLEMAEREKAKASCK